MGRRPPDLSHWLHEEQWEARISTRFGVGGAQGRQPFHPLIRCTLAERLDLVLAFKNLFIAPAPYKLQPYNKSLKVFIPPYNKKKLEDVYS